MLLYKADTPSVAHLKVGCQVILSNSDIRAAESLRWEPKVTTYFFRNKSMYFERGLEMELIPGIIGLPGGFCAFLWILAGDSISLFWDFLQ